MPSGTAALSATSNENRPTGRPAPAAPRDRLPGRSLISLLVNCDGSRPLVELRLRQIRQRQSDGQPRTAVSGKLQVLLDCNQIIGRHELKILVDEMDDVSPSEGRLQHAVALLFFLGKSKHAVHYDIGVAILDEVTQRRAVQHIFQIEELV